MLFFPSPTECSFVSIVVSLISVMICGGGTQLEFCKACRDQNWSAMTCVRCSTFFVRRKIMFCSILDQNAPIHEKMKRKYAEKYWTAEKWSVWRCSQSWTLGMHWAAARNYILESFVEWTLHLVEAKVSLLRLELITFSKIRHWHVIIPGAKSAKLFCGLLRMPWNSSAGQRLTIRIQRNELGRILFLLHAVPGRNLNCQRFPNFTSKVVQCNYDCALTRCQRWVLRKARCYTQKNIDIAIWRTLILIYSLFNRLQLCI